MTPPKFCKAVLLKCVIILQFGLLLKILPIVTFVFLIFNFTCSSLLVLYYTKGAIHISRN